MSEGKKVEYRRDNCREKVKGLLKRAEEINTGKADYNYYNRIKEMILFGSLVNTNKDKVHDIDILVVWDSNCELRMKFHYEHPKIFKDMIYDYFSEWYLTKRYLKGGSKVFSIHSNVEESNGIFDIARSDKHIILMSDYKALPENIDLIP